MKIINSEKSSNKLDELVVFEVPSSNRTIKLFDYEFKIHHYHLCLPRIRFVAWIKNYGTTPNNLPCLQYLSILYGVFLGDDGKVYPMMLPNLSINGSICFGDTKTCFTCSDLEELTDEIYSNFIQSDFTYEGSNTGEFFEHQGNPWRSLLNDRIISLSNQMDEFYTDWSSRGRNYDICSDLRVKRHREYIREIENWVDGSVYKKYLSMSG